MQQIFLRTGRWPHEVVALPDGQREFVYACMRVALEEEAGYRAERAERPRHR